MELVFGIIAAYEFLIEKLGFKWSQIVLYIFSIENLSKKSHSYGRSIGSGPTVYLSSHPDYPVSGIILHSPIASGFRIFDFDVKNTRFSMKISSLSFSLRRRMQMIYSQIVTLLSM